MSGLEELHWWQQGIIYQVYPRSFQDTDGNGIGDLAGIMQRLDYLTWLGIDAIWLNPIYPSPMADFGYDIADYTNVDPLFGTLEQLDRLLAAIHERQLRLILDFVPNHTSSQHPWFVESRSSRDNPKRDWYIWRDPGPDGRPPNNWMSNFGGSAWEWDERTQQFYLHAFLKEQPDLNWRNPDVQRAMLDVMRFWLDRGIDGFRVDVIWLLIKDEEMRNNPPNPQFRVGQAPHNEYLTTFVSDRPEVFNIIGLMRQVLDEYPDRMMVGEVYLPVERLMSYYGGGSGVHMPFNFQLIELPWNARVIQDAVNKYEALLPSYGWPNWVLGNHDQPRIASRTNSMQARVAAMLLLTLRGTPTMYYGDELAMRDVPIPPDRIRDPFEKNVPGLGLGRDPARTPMQWDNTPNAGFSTAEPWLPVPGDHVEINVQSESQNPTSLLSLYRALIQLRRSEPALVRGRYSPMPGNDHVMAYFRQDDRSRFLIILNLSPWPESYWLGSLCQHAHLRLSTFMDRQDTTCSERIEVRGDEGLILELAW